MLADCLVELDQEHPGFRDLDYRRRRDAIARVALEHRPGAPVAEVAYTPEEHEVWQRVWAELSPLHRRYACRAYLDAEARLGLSRTEIPQLASINADLTRSEGFSMLPVAGLITPKVFMDHLDESIFLATQYIRHWSRPLYTPEPDIVHEVIGHAPTLVQTDFVRLSRAFGRASKLATAEAIEGLIRVYWFTLEFGVISEASGLKVCGAGLLSSSGELSRFEQNAELLAFDLERMAHTPFDPTSYQDTLFVAPSFEHFVSELERWLGAQS